jgi:hypothetical protein
MARPEAVVIGTLRRPRLAIALRATVVRNETAPPPPAVFLERLLADPLSPYCPRCSLPLEPWHGDVGAAGTVMGYECRPCGTRLRWPPADVVKQMQREVRRHYAQYWERYQAAIEQHQGWTRRPVGEPPPRDLKVGTLRAAVRGLGLAWQAFEEA